MIFRAFSPCPQKATIPTEKTPVQINLPKKVLETRMEELPSVEILGDETIPIPTPVKNKKTKEEIENETLEPAHNLSGGNSNLISFIIYVKLMR